MERIRENLYRIPVPLPNNPLKELNAYFLQGTERSLLIDSGFRLEACRAALRKGLEEIGADLSTTDIVLTHIHTDHTGLADQLIAPGRRIYIAAGDYPMLTTAYDRWFWAAMDQRFRQEGFPEPLLERLSGTNPARALGPKLDLPCYTPLSHGAVLSVGARTLQVIHTPGHIPGQLCLWCPEEGILFSSDHILFDITPNINLWPNLPNSLSHYLDSLRAIDRLPARLVLPGHRGGGDLHDRVQTLLRHHANRAGETLAIVRAHPGRTAYEIAAGMTWDIQAEDWAHFPANQKWFATGEAIAHLEFLTAQGAVAREMNQNQVAQYRCSGGNAFAGF